MEEFDFIVAGGGSAGPGSAPRRMSPSALGAVLRMW